MDILKSKLLWWLRDTLNAFFLFFIILVQPLLLLLLPECCTVWCLITLRPPLHYVTCLDRLSFHLQLLQIFNFISVYAPQVRLDEFSKRQFWEDLDEIV